MSIGNFWREVSLLHYDILKTVARLQNFRRSLRGLVIHPRYETSGRPHRKTYLA